MPEAHHDTGYEQAHADGVASGYADWEQALADVLPDDVEPTPEQVRAYIERLHRDR